MLHLTKKKLVAGTSLVFTAHGGRLPVREVAVRNQKLLDECRWNYIALNALVAGSSPAGRPKGIP